MLIHERMLESYIMARKLFLKPGGRMFPSTGTIFVCPITDAALWHEQQVGGQCSGEVTRWECTSVCVLLCGGVRRGAVWVPCGVWH